MSVSSTFPSSHTHTQQKVRKLRIKDEIRFLYLKKASLNKTLHQTHLKVYIRSTILTLYFYCIILFNIIYIP